MTCSSLCKLRVVYCVGEVRWTAEMYPVAGTPWFSTHSQCRHSAFICHILCGLGIDYRLFRKEEKGTRISFLSLNCPISLGRVLSTYLQSFHTRFATTQQV